MIVPHAEAQTSPDICFTRVKMATKHLYTKSMISKGSHIYAANELMDSQITAHTTDYHILLLYALPASPGVQAASVSLKSS